MSLKREPNWTQASKSKLTNVFRNYNNNLNLNSEPSKTPNWCTRSPCLWNRGLVCTTIWLLKSTEEVYKPYPPQGLNLWPPKRKRMFLTVRPLSVKTIYDLQELNSIPPLATGTNSHGHHMQNFALPEAYFGMTSCLNLFA